MPIQYNLITGISGKDEPTLPKRIWVYRLPRMVYRFLTVDLHLPRFRRVRSSSTYSNNSPTRYFLDEK